MSFYEAITARRKALLEATQKKKGKGIEFLQSFTKVLMEHLKWPDQHVQTKFCLTEPEARVSCTLRLSLDLADYSPDDTISITLVAEPLKYQTEHSALFDLHVVDVMRFHVSGQDHEEHAKRWRDEVFPHVEERLSALSEKKFVEVFGKLAALPKEA